MFAIRTVACYTIAFEYSRPVPLLSGFEGLGRIGSQFGQHALEGAVLVQKSLATSQLAEQAEGGPAILAESVQRKILGIETVAEIGCRDEVWLRDMAFLEET